MPSRDSSSASFSKLQPGIAVTINVRLQKSVPNPTLLPVRLFPTIAPSFRFPKPNRPKVPKPLPTLILTVPELFNAASLIVIVHSLRLALPLCNNRLSDPRTSAASLPKPARLKALSAVQIAPLDCSYPRAPRPCNPSKKKNKKMPPAFQDDKSPICIPFILDHLSRHHQSHPDLPRPPLIIGLNGIQGVGKTTLVAALTLALEKHGAHAVVTSIDDFYLKHDDQVALAQSNRDNALVQHRGEPGKLQCIRTSNLQ